MSIQAILRHNLSGTWELLTNDPAQDVLADAPTEDEAYVLAAELDLEIVKPAPVLSGKATNACKTVGSLPLNTLFRIDNMWYRNIKMGKVCTVTVVGQKREIEMSGNMAISAVSVMNLV